MKGLASNSFYDEGNVTGSTQGATKFASGTFVLFKKL